MDGGTRPDIDDLKDDLLPLVEERRDNALRAILVDLHPADIAEFLAQMGDDEGQRYLFGLIADREHASSVLSELPSSPREGLLAEMSHEELADLVEEMSSDDAADLVQDLPEDVAQRVLEVIEPEERRAMSPLLAYDEETAGGIMATEVLSVPDTGTIADAREQVRTHGEDLEPFFYVYVIDAGGRLVGVLALRDLVLHRSGTPVREVMHRDPVTVEPELDQEEVADLFRRYDLFAMPVVGEGGELLGRITIDDVVDVMREEAEEDFARMAGTDEEQFHELSVRRIALYRLPWILVSLGGGFVSGLLLHHFTGSLGIGIALIAFAPVIMAMGGNAGSQAAITMVRLLAFRNVSGREMGAIVWREARVGLMLGLVTGVAMGLVAFAWKGAWIYGAVVGGSLGLAVLVAAMMGALTPILFKRMNVDPAVATGPFVTITNDASGLLIYFGLATLFLRIVGGSP